MAVVSTYPTRALTQLVGVDASGNVGLQSPYTVTQLDKGTISTGTVTFNHSTGGPKQKLTVGGALTIAFAGWPASGTYGEIEIDLVNGGAFTVTKPTVNWLKGDGSSSTTFADMGVVLQSSGHNFLTVWTMDGGTTLYGVGA